MTMDPMNKSNVSQAGTADHPLIASAFDRLSGLSERLSALDASALELANSNDAAVSEEARRVRKRIREFEPSVTMIGQVKAGKTTLVNAMAGRPGVLPSDVNPWTSVVTSLHLTPGLGQSMGRASFRFFTEDEWTNLVQRGGRVGELASRAGADDELEKVRRQLEDMREKSRERLGRRFELLLGQTHDYDNVDEGLIERYVCLGDDFWEDTGASRDQGRFADITKTADLWLGRPELPLGLCVRDTPGVNDTFMIREQITINALRGSRICVVVLSAHQALSSVDLALIRLISNVKSRDVIIFVNRIDELSDPAQEVPEIRNSIQETLRRFDGPADAQVIFGSGFWANHALNGDFEALGVDSAQSLLSWAEAPETAACPRNTVEEMVWHLSGIPALGQAIAARIESGDGAKFEDLIERAVGNLRKSVTAAQAIRVAPSENANMPTLSATDVEAEMTRIAHVVFQDLEAKLLQVRQGFLDRLEKSHHAFLGRATASLISHLEFYGDQEIWNYDPSGLRILLRSGYQVFGRSASKIGQEVLDKAARDVSALYDQVFPPADGVGLSLDPPPLPSAPAPVVLGQTIALDMRGNWWTRFWRRRRGYEAFVDDFAKLIREETGPIVEALKTDNSDAYEMLIRDTLREFFESQRATIVDLANGRPVDIAGAQMREPEPASLRPEPPKIMPVRPHAVRRA